MSSSTSEVIAPASTVEPVAISVGVPPSPGTATARHAFPVDGDASFAHSHHDYPASDVIANCGLTALAPVDGVVVHWRVEDHYVAAVDNPALRGGRSLAILGDDGVRYYMSHFQSLAADLGLGSRVRAGQAVAIIGRSGDAGVCHIHFGISAMCAQGEWSVRRGVIWPWRYLEAWRDGSDESPAIEVADWLLAHPTSCAEAASDPMAGDAG